MKYTLKELADPGSKNQDCLKPDFISKYRPSSVSGRIVNELYGGTYRSVDVLIHP